MNPERILIVHESQSRKNNRWFHGHGVYFAAARADIIIGLCADGTAECVKHRDLGLRDIEVRHFLAGIK